MLKDLQTKAWKETHPDENGLYEMPWDQIRENSKILVLGSRNIGKTTFAKYLLFRLKSTIDYASVLFSRHIYRLDDFDEILPKDRTFQDEKLFSEQERNVRISLENRLLVVVDDSCSFEQKEDQRLIKLCSMNLPMICMQQYFSAKTYHLYKHFDYLVLFQQNNLDCFDRIYKFVSGILPNPNEFSFMLSYYTIDFGTLVFDLRQQPDQPLSKRVFYSKALQIPPALFSYPKNPTHFKERFAKSQRWLKVVFHSLLQQIFPLPPVLIELIWKYITGEYAFSTNDTNEKQSGWSYVLSTTHKFHSLTFHSIKEFKNNLFYTTVDPLLSKDVFFIFWSYLTPYYCNLCGVPTIWSDKELEDLSIKRYICEFCSFRHNNTDSELHKWIYMLED
jgi:hypothetical protein